MGSFTITMLAIRAPVLPLAVLLFTPSAGVVAVTAAARPPAPITAAGRPIRPLLSRDADGGQLHRSQRPKSAVAAVGPRQESKEM
jgi:hypothetical protein